VTATDWTIWIGGAVAAYLTGSIPFGLLISRARGVDIRQRGSGNIGATNVGRVLGARYGLACFVLDVLKGLAPVIATGALAGALGAWRLPASSLALWYAVAAAAVLGHMFPVWLRFKGGKGIATGFGALAGMWPLMSIPALAALAIWLFAVRITRYVGISSCIAALVLPVLAAATALLGPSGRSEPVPATLGWAWPSVVLSALLAAVVVWKHRGNIARTIAGTEPRASLLGSGAPSESDSRTPS